MQLVVYNITLEINYNSLSDYLQEQSFVFFRKPQI